MSLDVSLTLPGQSNSGSGIFVRENGQTKEITRAEWDEKFPGREPVIADTESDEVYWVNITYNLNRMAKEAGIYRHLWRPDELNITQAADLIVPLRVGLKTLEDDPSRFEKFNPENGWGDYDGLVRFVREYLEACEKYPQAEIRVSR